MLVIDYDQLRALIAAPLYADLRKNTTDAADKCRLQALKEADDLIYCSTYVYTRAGDS